MVLNLPYPITAFLQLIRYLNNYLARWYDLQHEWEVLLIAATPDKTFRLKVEVMPTGRWNQYINELHGQIIGLELDITVYFEKQVPDYHFIVQSNVAIAPLHYLVSNP